MAGGLVGLLDDVAALAKLAAASIDDVGAAAGRASAKAAGVVIDDTAVTPAYVHGLAAERELPIVGRIARGSLRNKLLFILPAALVLSEFTPLLVEVILVFGGCYLAYEGAEKIHHRIVRHRTGETHGTAAPVTAATAATAGDHEARTVAGAIRTDFVLSAEIMVIALKEVLDEALLARAVILVVVGVLITLGVYGLVALIVKMDDIGLRMAGSDRPLGRRVGRAMVVGMPDVLAVLSSVGTVAMLWVGGHILVSGAHELGWHAPAELLHSIEDPFHSVPTVGGALGWLVGTLVSAAVGLVVGVVLVTLSGHLPRRRRSGHDVQRSKASSA